MNKYFQKLRQLGIQSDMSRIEQKRIALLNDIMLLACVMECFQYIEVLSFKNMAALLSLLGFQIATILPLLLHYFKKINVARWYFNVLFPLFLTLVIIMHGKDLEANSCYFVFAVTAIFFFEKKRQRIFLVIFVMTNYYFAQYYVANYPAPLAENVTPVINFAAFTVVILSLALVVARFVDSNIVFEKETNELLNNLKASKLQVSQQNKGLEQANKELEKFAYIASHDLKSPLRNITSFLGLIQRKLKNHEDNDLHDYLKYVRNSATQMNYLIQDILEYSKVGYRGEYTKVDLKEIIEEAKVNLKADLENKSAQITYSGLPTIFANRIQMILLFQNLIENGIKYNEKATPTIEIKNEVTEEYNIIRIKDNGIGIAKEHQAKVFEMFKRLHTQVDYQGSGIGLAICKKIVQQHHGKIEIESQVGKGTTFFIKLPQEQQV